MVIFPLTLQGATVQRRGRVLLGPMDLQLRAGGFTVVLGPNGAGKTTLLRVMHGVERLSAGSAGWAVTDRAAREKQSFVFQTPILLRRSVAENLTYPLRLKRRGRAECQAQALNWATRIGLQDALSLPARRLSGGEKQKLALARALITDPDVLFLDEPTANLDGRSKREIEVLLQAAHAGGTTIVMATHDLGQARRLARDVVFLLRGQIQDQGPASALFDGARSAEFTRFIQGDIVE